MKIWIPSTEALLLCHTVHALCWPFIFLDFFFFWFVAFQWILLFFFYFFYSFQYPLFMLILYIFCFLFFFFVFVFFSFSQRASDVLFFILGDNAVNGSTTATAAAAPSFLQSFLQATATADVGRQQWYQTIKLQPAIQTDRRTDIVNVGVIVTDAVAVIMMWTMMTMTMTMKKYLHIFIVVSKK